MLRYRHLWPLVKMLPPEFAHAFGLRLLNLPIRFAPAPAHEPFTWGGLTFELVTGRGAIVVDAFRQNLTVYRHDLQRPVWAYWGSDMNQAMIDEFVAAIREEREPRVTGLDGYRAVEVVLAAYESAAIGQPVRLHSTA